MRCKRCQKNQKGFPIFFGHFFILIQKFHERRDRGIKLKVLNIGTNFFDKFMNCILTVAFCLKLCDLIQKSFYAHDAVGLPGLGFFQGLILGPDGEKMSKSRGNVINPDEIIEAHGADAFRMYEMFMGPF